jgi:hypothetical protein
MSLRNVGIHYSTTRCLNPEYHNLKNHEPRNRNYFYRTELLRCCVRLWQHIASIGRGMCWLQIVLVLTVGWSASNSLFVVICGHFHGGGNAYSEEQLETYVLYIFFSMLDVTIGLWSARNTASCRECPPTSLAPLHYFTNSTWMQNPKSHSNIATPSPRDAAWLRVADINIQRLRSWTCNQSRCNFQSRELNLWALLRDILFGYNIFIIR